MHVALAAAAVKAIESVQDKGESGARPFVADDKLFFNALRQSGVVDCAAPAQGILAAKAAIEVIADLRFATSVMKLLQLHSCPASVEFGTAQAHGGQDPACSPEA